MLVRLAPPAGDQRPKERYGDERIAHAPGRPGARDCDRFAGRPRDRLGASHHGAKRSQGRWLSGDLSNHTFLTNGKALRSDILAKAIPAAPVGFGLNYFANAEQGGQSKANAQGLSRTFPPARSGAG